MSRTVDNSKFLFYIILTLFHFQNVDAFILQQRIVNYYDNEIMLKNLHNLKELKIQVENMFDQSDDQIQQQVAQGDSSTDIQVLQVESSKKLLKKVINIQLRQIKDINNPLESEQISRNVCEFADEGEDEGQKRKCEVNFESLQVNNQSRHLVRLESQFGFVKIKVSFHEQKLDELLQYPQFFNQYMWLSPSNQMNPGFRFYFARPTIFKFYLSQASFPTPTISSYNFTLWVIDQQKGIKMTALRSRSLKFQYLPINFTIQSPGHYFLSIKLNITKIDSKTVYPIKHLFIYTQDACEEGKYWNKFLQRCFSCKNIKHAKEVTINYGVCQCQTGYQWIDVDCVPIQNYRFNDSDKIINKNTDSTIESTSNEPVTQLQTPKTDSSSVSPTSSFTSQNLQKQSQPKQRISKQQVQMPKQNSNRVQATIIPAGAVSVPIPILIPVQSNNSNNSLPLTTASPEQQSQNDTQSPKDIEQSEQQQKIEQIVIGQQKQQIITFSDFSSFKQQKQIKQQQGKINGN